MQKTILEYVITHLEQIHVHRNVLWITEKKFHEKLFCVYRWDSEVCFQWTLYMRPQGRGFVNDSEATIWQYDDESMSRLHSYYTHSYYCKYCRKYFLNGHKVSTYSKEVPTQRAILNTVICDLGPVLSRWGIFVAIANNTLYGSKW